VEGDVGEGEAEGRAGVTKTDVGSVVMNVGDRVGEREVVLAVEFEYWRRVRWMCGCVGADAVALWMEMAERIMRSDGVFIVMV
jgi:hypothetical protein